ncbi:hypothetical protein [Halomonas sp. H10-9-1]|uniref:hypothetical protein n=1 Tax=Halomonas sp. H10-9-1 TaxID=2950871 RepID=UPI0032DFA5E9
MARKMIDAPLHDGDHYRRQRLEEERERLHRRLVWATARKDRQAIRWLEKRLEEVEEALDADLEPGREPGRFDRHRRR